MKKKEVSINLPNRAIDIDGAILEIEGYLQENKPQALIDFVLKRLEEKHGKLAAQTVIKSLALIGKYTQTKGD